MVVDLDCDPQYLCIFFFWTFEIRQTFLITRLQFFCFDFWPRFVFKKILRMANLSTVHCDPQRKISNQMLTDSVQFDIKYRLQLKCFCFFGCNCLGEMCTHIIRTNETNGNELFRGG